jgi:hypothetical protein
VRQRESTEIKEERQNGKAENYPETISYHSRALHCSTRTMISILLLQCLGVGVIGLVFVFLRRTGRRGPNLPPGTTGGENPHEEEEPARLIME